MQDGLFDENVGPSLYAKAQGVPVTIWGFLGNGRIEYYVLPEDVNEQGRKKTTNMSHTLSGITLIPIGSRTCSTNALEKKASS